MPIELECHSGNKGVATDYSSSTFSSPSLSSVPFQPAWNGEINVPFFKGVGQTFLSFQFLFVLFICWLDYALDNVLPRIGYLQKSV
jgi:hypothetical protein